MMTSTEQLVVTHIGGGFTEEQWELIFELRCYGYTLRELADWLGISGSTIQYHFKRLGLISSVRPSLSTYNEKLRKLGDTDARP